MKSIRIFHPCRPGYDNLGEIAANESVVPMFRRRGIVVERNEDDFLARRAAGRFLDDRIDEINASFDMIMIGPAGFLGPKMIDSMFSSLAAWERLETPLCFNGVGVVASAARPVWYGAMSEDTHALRALRRARAVSTRDLNSWLLAARAMGGDTARLTLAGCPSVRFARCDPPPAKTHDLALNLSFLHENCRQHVPLLLQIARTIHDHRHRVLWIAHSRLDELQAIGVNRQLGLGFDIVRPRSGAEAGAAYAACDFALVTRFHAGIFCVANSIPLGFIGYDVKCWQLMSMFAAEPHQYVLPIDRLTESGVENDIARLFRHIERNAEPLRQAERLLAAYFDAQTDRFVDAAVAAVRTCRRGDGESVVAVENPAHEVTGTHTA